MQSTLLCNAREFDDALLFIEKISGPITSQVGLHFLSPEELDESKVMQDNMYTFTYRKMVAQYHINFMDYNNAISQLRLILQDELKYYGMVEEKKDETEVDAVEKLVDDLKAEGGISAEFKPIELS